MKGSKPTHFSVTEHFSFSSLGNAYKTLAANKVGSLETLDKWTLGRKRLYQSVMEVMKGGLSESV